MFYAHDACCEQERNDRKSFLRPVELRFPRRSCAKLGLGLVRLHFGGVWDALGRLLDVTWPALGDSWTALGPSWARLGGLPWKPPLLNKERWCSAKCASFWVSWDAFWPHFGCLGTLWDLILALWGRLGATFWPKLAQVGPR